MSGINCQLIVYILVVLIMFKKRIDKYLVKLNALNLWIVLVNLR